MKSFRYCTTVFIVFILSGYLPGCSNHYDSSNTITDASAYPRALERGMKNKRYFIMYSGLDTYTVRSVLVDKPHQQFTVHLNKVDSMRLSKIRKRESFNEKMLTIYMNDSTSYTLDEPHTISLAKIGRIEVGQ